MLTQATNQAEVEVFPESETRFFLKVVDSQIEFIRSPDGKVDRLILFQAGREITGKRVN